MCRAFLLNGVDVFGWQHKLIWNWKSAYKWASIQFVTLGAAIQLALLAFPNDIRQFLPDWATHATALFCFAAAAYGRVTTRDPQQMTAPPQKDQDHV